MEFNKKTAYVYIKTQAGQAKQVYEQFRKQDWVIGAWAVTGEYDIIAWVNARNDDDVYTYANTMKGWAGIDYTTSYFVHNGYFHDYNKIDDPNGVWVRLRTEHMQEALGHFKEHDYIRSWANLPGEYDFLLYVTGDSTRVALENVMRLTENHKWRTQTYVPVYHYLNANYAKTF
jgi:hypothetical protein